MSKLGEIIKGKYLTMLADHYGVKRKWFGLEPDWHLRKRMIDKICNTTEVASYGFSDKERGR